MICFHQIREKEFKIQTQLIPKTLKSLVKILIISDFTTDQDLLGITDTLGTTYVYVADTGNHCIRRISLSSSHVDTIAGV
jgi:hypothetical protein